MPMIELTGNWFAAFAILAWPFVAIILFRSLGPYKGTLWTILGALLLLPTGPAIKISMLPSIDKSSIASICALVGCIICVPAKRYFRRFGTVEFLVVLLVAGPVITSELNNDVVTIGDHVLPGVGYYDGISALIAQLIVLIPFLIGRRLFRVEADVELIPRALIIAGLAYTVPMLIEIRLSPQLSNWIYGYFQGFNTEMRYGGFRPVVFMKNGLAAAFFMSTAFLASLAVWRVDGRAKAIQRGIVSSCLGIILVLCKSAGALIYGLLGGLLIRFASPKALSRIAVVLVSIGLLYPVFRAADIFPDKILVGTAAYFNKDRAASLQFRFDQERQLLNRALERFMFGWGRYGRNRVYEESGKDTSITDGAWIQTIGQFGLIGFLAEFGLLGLPVFRAARALRFVRSERERLFVSLLAFISALSIVEQIPNSSINTWTWFVAGGLLGITERVALVSRLRMKNRAPSGRQEYASA